MARVNLGKVVPEKGVDYMTPTEQQTFVRDITADVESELTPYVNTKKGEITDTATTATTNFNDNAVSKTSDFNTNATDKTTAFNNNAASKTQDFNDNAAAKIAQLEYDLTPYSKIVDTGSKIILTINNTNFKMTASLKDKNDNVINTSNEIDLPLESVVVNGAYDSQTKKVILTLQNGNTIEFSVADLVAGLQTEITNANKLNSDLVDDSNSVNKFTNTTEKNSWNNKYDKPNGGIPKTDLAEAVQTSLEKADTSIQESDLANYVKNTDYANVNTAGIIKIGYGLLLGNDKKTLVQNYSFEQYASCSANIFISKGTLENVITGKGLVSNTDYATSNNAGIIKIGNGVSLDANKKIQCIGLSAESYEQQAGSIFISKQTLTNVLNVKIGDINSILDDINR